MRIRQIHDWGFSPSEAIAAQKALRGRISLRDKVSLKGIRLVAGADVSYKGDRLFGAVVLLGFPDLEPVEEIWATDRVSFPYVPGLLTFREAPVLLRAFRLLKRKPDAAIFDGQGIAHPRGLGLAAHAGLFLNIPSVGCAKTRLVGEDRAVRGERGSFAWVSYQGKRVGTVVRTRKDVKPVYVSPGHQISFGTATRLVLATCRNYRLPEPIRLAHHLANQRRMKGS